MSRTINKFPTDNNISLKNYIQLHFNKENGKFFYSIEISPKAGFIVDFSEFVKLPLFINLTWIKDENLKMQFKDCSSFKIGHEIESVPVVHSITCYNLNDQKLQEILNENSVKNLLVLRGGA